MPGHTKRKSGGRKMSGFYTAPKRMNKRSGGRKKKRRG